MGMQTYFSDGDAPATPFNIGLQKNSQKTKDRHGIDQETMGMADTIQGLSQKNARMWQIIALVSLSAFFISLGICFYAVTLPKTVPVIVTVDTQGQATYVGEVDRSYWGRDKIPETAKTYQIKRLIANMYTWVIDRNAQNSYISECGKICQGSAVDLLNSFFLTNNPFDWIGVKTQSVVMEEPLRQTDKTYVIYYNVLTLKGGKPESNKRYSALVTLEFYQGIPADNPLGIFITSFDIKEVLK